MKHVLFTTTALVALSGSAFADVSWSGSASLAYNDAGGESGINSDIDLDVSMSNSGGYTASVSAAIDNAFGDDGYDLIIGEDIDITTPVASIHYGEVVEAANSAYSDTDGLSGLGSDEFTSADGSGAAILVSASTGGMTVGFSDDSSVDGSARHLVSAVILVVLALVSVQKAMTGVFLLQVAQWVVPFRSQARKSMANQVQV